MGQKGLKLSSKKNKKSAEAGYVLPSLRFCPSGIGFNLFGLLYHIFIYRSIHFGLRKKIKEGYIK